MNPLHTTPRDLMIGELHQEYYLSDRGLIRGDIPGGPSLYATAGYLIWEEEHQPGLLTRVGSDYPREWLEVFQARQIHTDGVHFLDQPFDLRVCYGLEGERYRKLRDLPSYCSREVISIPKQLIDYAPQDAGGLKRRERKTTSIREQDVPGSYLGATGAHLCQGDFLSHQLIPAVLRSRGYTTLTLDPGPEYMDPAFLGDIPGLLIGLTAFLPSEEELLNLFKGQMANLGEIARELSRYGCPIIVIKRGEDGQLVYDRDSGRLVEIPAYPSRIKNRAGAGDAFCGGFLAGYRKTFDAVEAALYGSAAASLVVEGCGPFYALDATPGLVEARFDYLQKRIQEQ